MNLKSKFSVSFRQSEYDRFVITHVYHYCMYLLLLLCMYPRVNKELSMDMWHCVYVRTFCVFGPCDACILNFEFYVFVFGLYCFGLAHYRGRVLIIFSIRNPNHNFYLISCRYLENHMRDNNYDTTFSYQLIYNLFSCPQTHVPSILSRRTPLLLTPVLVLSFDFYVLSYVFWISTFTVCVLTFLFWNVFSNFKPFIGISIKQFMFDG